MVLIMKKLMKMYRTDANKSALTSGAAFGVRGQASRGAPCRYRHHRFWVAGAPRGMLGKPNDCKPKLQVQLEATAIPALPGSLELLEAGHASSLAPSNRRAWDLLDPQPSPSSSPAVTLNLGQIPKGRHQHQAILELLVDPQTCGPLLISVTEQLSEALLKQNPQGWWPIGRARAN